MTDILRMLGTALNFIVVFFRVVSVVDSFGGLMYVQEDHGDSDVEYPTDGNYLNAPLPGKIKRDGP